MAAGINGLSMDIRAQIIRELDVESLRKFVMLNKDAADVTWKTLAEGLGISTQNRTEEEYHSEIVTTLKSNSKFISELRDIGDSLGEGTPMKILLEAIVEGDNNGLETFI